MKFGITRRTLLEGAAAAALTAGAIGALRFRKVDGSWLRPPGALPKGDFEAACIRCFRCAEVCPPRCITFHADLPPAEADTPFIDASSNACTLCMQCAPACPTGALVQIARKDVRMGAPVLNTSTCFAHTGARPCRVCFDVCPFQNGAVSLNARLAPVFHAVCTGCGLCEAACPSEDTTGEKAIRIIPIRS